mgnify:CR=1 FL=1
MRGSDTAAIVRSTSCQRSSDSASGRRIERPALLTSMSIWACVACHQNRFAVMRTRADQNASRGVYRRAANRYVRATTTSADTTEGMRAEMAETSPNGFDTAAMAQNSSGGFSR